MKISALIFSKGSWVRALFVHYGARSIQEVMQIVTYSLQEYVKNSKNIIICSLGSSNASVLSRIRA